MAHTRLWTTYEGKPAGADLISGGDNELRATKVDIRERLAVDHVMNVSTTTDGYHNKCTMPVQSSKPTAVASAGILYTKDVSAKAELFFEDEDADE